MLNAYVFASVALLSKYYILGKKKRGFQNRTEQELGTTRCTALCTCTLNCMFVCMYFIACYYELFYINCNIVTCVTVNELWKS